MANSSVIENIFVQEPVLDQRIRKYELNRYTTTQPFQASANPTEITIDTLSGSLDSFPLLDRSFLGVNFKFVSAGATEFTTTAKNQLIANGWLMFARAALYINDHQIESVDRPGLIAHMKKLIESSRDSIAGNAGASSYYPNEGDALEALSDTDNTLPADGNLYRAATRYNAAAASPYHFVRLYLRDVFGFAAVSKALPGCRIKVVLTPETSFERCIMKSGSSNANIVRLLAADLYLANARPDNELLRQVYNEFTAGKTVPFEIEQRRYLSIPIADGSSSVNATLPNHHKRPTSVAILMQADSQYTTFAGDKLAGTTFDFTTHRLQVDAKQYPENGGEGKNKGYLAEYETFLQLGGKHNNDVFGSWVNFDKWKAVYPLLCYDVSALRDEMAGVRSRPPNIQWNANISDPGAAATAHVMICGKELWNLNMINGILTISNPDFSD